MLAAASTKTYEHSPKPSYDFLWMLLYLIPQVIWWVLCLMLPAGGTKSKDLGSTVSWLLSGFFNIKPHSDINLLLNFVKFSSCYSAQTALGTGAIRHKTNPGCDNSAQTALWTGAIRHKIDQGLWQLGTNGLWHRCDPAQIPNSQVSPGTKAMGEKCHPAETNQWFAFWV